MRPSKRSRREEEEDDEEIDSDDMQDEMFRNLRSETGDDDDDSEDFPEEESGRGDESDEEEEDDEEDEGELEEEDDDEEEEEEEEEDDDGREERKTEEMEQLEKEYTELRNHEQEQDVLWNLKRHKDEDILKGQAVKNQKALWDKTLEFRILLQKSFSSSNRLPQEPIRSSFCTSGEGVSDAYSDLITSAKKTLNSMLELQEALLEKNPAIAQDAGSRNHSKDVGASRVSYGEGDEEWAKISQMQSRIACFRDKSVDKWHRKSQMTTGAAAIKGKLQAFNQNISDQVAAYMKDPSKMIKGMQQNRSAAALFGTVVGSVDDIKQEVVNAEGDPELLDDSQFYGQLLKEFLESSEAEYYARKRMQTKKRKIVDRRASKSRKIRYHVHEKIVNFMAPQPMDIPDMAPKLFQNLFGLRT